MVTGGSISVNGLTRSYLVRLLPDGNLDAGFSYALNSYPKDMHLLGDGRILVIVSYNDATGFPRYRLVRLNSDGSLDGTFDSEATASSTYSYFYNVAVQTDGKILVAGDFSSVGGVSRRSIARFNANGTLDTGFVAPPTIPSINSLAIQADGKILLAGKVKIVNSIATDGIIRLLDTGSLDGTFNPANYAGEVLGLQTDGKILMGGGYPDSDLLRLNPDGTRDPYFNVDANNPISCASIGPDGRIFVAGTFTEIGGVVRSRIARLPNNIVATRSLQAVSASEITWNRGGSSPEIQDALFERWNGANWVSLGKATRISGGWSLAGLSLGQGGYIRCRSTVSNHNLGGSGSAMLEEVQLYNLTGFGFSPLQIWRIDHFGNNENIGDGANANDWDLDGVCNLMEFALGTDPRTSSSIPKPASAWEKIEGEDYFTLTFSKPPGATGILYTPQYSEKLVTWGNGSGLLTLFEEADSVLKFGIKRTEASGFMRLSVSEE